MRDVQAPGPPMKRLALYLVAALLAVGLLYVAHAATQTDRLDCGNGPNMPNSFDCD